MKINKIDDDTLEVVVEHKTIITKEQLLKQKADIEEKLALLNQ